MKVVGLITEYNPFHNGHKYHIEEAKRITGADYVIAVMSGNFVQRGTPAIIDKYSRTRMALNNGIDLVLELPVCYATGSAEFFAHGAVSLLSSLGVVDYICFGSEVGDINLLQNAAKLLLKAPASFDEKLKIYLKEGLTYPAARQRALEFLLQLPSIGLPDPADQLLMTLLTEPNNILGIEYIKAIHNLSASLQPVTIRREAAHYHKAELTAKPSEALSSECDDASELSAVISSATAIRRAINNNVIDIDRIDVLSKIEESVPADVYQQLTEQLLRAFPITIEDFAQSIKYKLLAEDSTSLAQYLDISQDLADRIKNLTDINLGIAELTNQLKTKNMTLTRISRALIHILLNIHTKDLAEYKAQGYSSYARVLGFRQNSSGLLRSIQKNSRIPVITKVSKAGKLLNEHGLRILSGDIFAAHLYNQIVYEKYATKLADEYRHGMIII